MIEIPLTQGQVTIIDDEDYVLVGLHNWSVKHAANDRIYYASTNIRRKNRWRGVLLHRFLMGEPLGLQIDHINGDTLDNRRNNLRFATNQQNSINQRSKGGSSRYKGVGWHKKRRAWEAQMCINGKSKFLGYFDDEKDAALAYDEKAFEAWGEFARLNFPLAYWAGRGRDGSIGSL